jgi:hydrogenase-4 component B
LPGIGAALAIAIDPLSALFLFIISLVSFCTTLFSIRYIRRYEPNFSFEKKSLIKRNTEEFLKDGGESLLRYYPPLLLLFASVVGIVAVRDLFFFIAFWEIMTLTSYALVVYERENKVSLKAGFQYFFVTHVAAACLILAAIILYPRTSEPHSFSFDAMRDSMGTLLTNNTGLLHLVLALFFIGFITKAGILPFSFWLPNAYPAAPSSASAAFSGTMTKLGIYGIIRVFCGFLPISHHSYIWGEVIAVFGTISIFVGTISALTQDDSKKMMSMSIIGQMGYIALGVGLGVYLLPINPAISTIALIASVFHLLNNVCYKSCLFLNAGSILYKTNTGNLNKVGGLIGVMPFTAATAIIASLSIAGIPPFSGFSSKLLIFESSLIAGMDSQAEFTLFIVLGIIAIFISAVTLAYSLKFLNSAFLGKLYTESEINPNRQPPTPIPLTSPPLPSSGGAGVGRRGWGWVGGQGGCGKGDGDVPLSMKIPQAILAFFCVFFGVVPFIPVRAIHKAISTILPSNYSPEAGTLFGRTLLGMNINFGEGISGAWNPLWIIAAFVVCFGIAYFIYKSAGVKVRQVETWYGGREHEAKNVRYPAHSFYVPFKRFFDFRIGSIEFEGLYPKAITLPKITMPKTLRTILDIDRWLYYPIVKGFMRISRGFSRTHVGIPQVYILWMIIGLVAAIIILFLLPKG